MVLALGRSASVPDVGLREIWARHQNAADLLERHQLGMGGMGLGMEFGHKNPLRSTTLDRLLVGTFEVTIVEKQPHLEIP